MCQIKVYWFKFNEWMNKLNRNFNKNFNFLFYKFNMIIYNEKTIVSFDFFLNNLINWR